MASKFISKGCLVLVCQSINQLPSSLRSQPMVEPLFQLSTHVGSLGLFLYQQSTMQFSSSAKHLLNTSLSSFAEEWSNVGVSMPQPMAFVVFFTEPPHQSGMTPSIPETQRVLNSINVSSFCYTENSSMAF